MEKVEFYGVSDRELMWFRPYLRPPDNNNVLYMDIYLLKETHYVESFKGLFLVPWYSSFS